MNTTCDSSTYHSVTNPHLSPIDWKAFYELLDRRTDAARQVVRGSLDIPYGDHVKQQLDVYGPSRTGDASPVLIFVHGGGMIEGDRRHYGYIAKPFADHGVVTVIPSYRLAPAATYPSQPDDIKLVVEWVFNNISGHGGDPGRISICGHSAGAHLSSFVSVDTRWLQSAGLPAGCIRSCVPISGNYDFVTYPNNPYLPSDVRAREASPMHNIHEPVDRLVVAIGSLEDYWIATSTDFVEKLRAEGADAQLLVLDGMDHADTVITLGDDGELGRRILELL